MSTLRWWLGLLIANQILAQERSFELGFSSCLHHSRRPWRFFNDLLRPKSSNVSQHFLVLGDFVYADVSHWSQSNDSITDQLNLLSEAQHSSLLEGLYTGALADTFLSGFMRRANVSFMWDDHEIVDNYDKGKMTQEYQVARKMFDKHITWRNPRPWRLGDMYYSLSDASAGVEVFVLDTRSYRSPKDMEDTGSKSMLGATQLADVKRWLRDSPAERFKVIASSVMWNDQSVYATYEGKPVLDSWAFYKRERQELFDFVAQQWITNVVLISGDSHWSGAFYFKDTGIWEFSASPLAAPQLQAPSDFASSGLASTPDFIAEFNGDSSEFTGEFGLLQISHASLVFRLMPIRHGVALQKPIYEKTIKRQMSAERWI